MADLPLGQQGHGLGLGAAHSKGLEKGQQNVQSVLDSTNLNRIEQQHKLGLGVQIAKSATVSRYSIHKIEHENIYVFNKCSYWRRR